MFLERFFPTYMYNKVEDIPFELLKKLDVKAILFDMDNTLIDYKYKISDELKIWISNLKEKKIDIIILSNTFRIDKTKEISKILDIPYIINANKPWSFGFKKAINRLSVDKKNSIMVGDQIFTDIYGGNRFGIKTILINPVNKKELFWTRLRRPLERFVLKKYYERIKGKLDET